MERHQVVIDTSRCIGCGICETVCVARWVSGMQTRLTMPSVSHHLQILKESGIAAMRKPETRSYYYLSTDETQ